MWYRLGAVCLAALLALTGCGKDDKGRRAREAAGPDSAQTQVTALAGAKKTDTGERSTSTSRARLTTQPDDEPLTGPTVLLLGRVLHHDGKPATTGTVQLRTAAAKESPGYVGIADIAEDGHFRVKSPDTEKLYWAAAGEFPTLIGQVESEYFPPKDKTTPALREVKKDILLPRIHSIQGRVINEKNEPMPGVTVDVRNAVNSTLAGAMQSVSTTPEGDFEFAQVYEGAAPLMLRASAREYADVFREVTVPTTETITLKLDSRGGALAGVALSKETSQGMPDLEIQLLRRGDSASTKNAMAPIVLKTNANGEFLYEHLAPGGYAIGTVATADGKPLGFASPRPTNIVIEDGQTTHVTYYIYEGHTVMGSVYDKDTSETLAGALIDFTLRPGEPAETDAMGQFRASGVFPSGSTFDTCLIRVELPGYRLDAIHSTVDYQMTALPDDGLIVVKDLAMIKTVAVRGTVHNSDGVPVAGAKVEALVSSNFGLDGRNDNRPVTTAADGTFELEVLPFSNMRAIASASGYAEGQSEPLNVGTDDLDDVKIVLERGATVRGVVLQPDGLPAANAEIERTTDYTFANGKSGKRTEAVAHSGADGRFVVQDFPRAAELSAKHEAFVDSEQLKVETEPGEIKQGVTLQLREALSISGRVVTPDKQPIPNLTVQIPGAEYKFMDTNAKGEFEFTKLAEGLYNIKIGPLGGASVEGASGVAAGTTGLEIVYTEAEELKLIGTVQDIETKKPIKDFSVKGYGRGYEKLEEPGKFVLRNLSVNNFYMIEISAPDYETKSFQVAMHSQQSGEKEQTFELGREGAITGRVMQGSDKKPAVGVTVSIQDKGLFSEQKPKKYTTTDEEGKFILAPVSTGNNTVAVTPKAPLVEVVQSVNVESGEVVDLGDIELVVGGTIAGRVVRGAKKEPVAGVKVALNVESGQSDSSDRTVVTDTEGRFEFDALKPKVYVVRTSNQRRMVKLTDDATAEVELHMGGVTVVGSVTRGGEPHETFLRATGGDGFHQSVYTKDGEYKLEGLEPGKYEFVTGSNVVRPQLETVEVPDKEEFRHDIQLTEGKIIATVLDSDGKPVPGATVSLVPERSGNERQRGYSPKNTSSEGKVDIPSVGAGKYLISAHKQGVGSVHQDGIEMKDGETKDIELRLDEQTGTLESVALDYKTGEDVEEAYCTALPETGVMSYSGKRDDSGVMKVDLPPGRYSVTVGASGMNRREHWVVIKANETTRLSDVLYPAGNLRCVVYRENGAPLIGVAVQLTAVSTDPMESDQSGTVRETGFYSKLGLAPGTYRLTVTPEGESPVTENVTIIAGETTEMQVVVPAR